MLEWTPTGTGCATVDTFGSSDDTLLAIYLGCPGSGTELDCDDDTNSATSSYQSQVQTDVTAGSTYYILLTGYSSAPENSVLNISLDTSSTCSGSSGGWDTGWMSWDTGWW